MTDRSASEQEAYDEMLRVAREATAWPSTDSLRLAAGRVVVMFADNPRVAELGNGYVDAIDELMAAANQPVIHGWTSLGCLCGHPNLQPPKDVVIERMKITHGRHCTCSSCARENWTNPNLADCGMHGSACLPQYQPLGPAGTWV